MTEGRVIIEPYQVMDDFVTEVGRIDQVGPDLYRVLLVSCEPCSIDGSLERVLKAKLFMTSEAMQAIVESARIDRSYAVGLARRAMRLCQGLLGDAEEVEEYRRQLATALY